MPDVPYEGRGFGVAMKGMGSLSSAIAKQKQTEASTSGASSAGIKDLAAGGVPDPSKAQDIPPEAIAQAKADAAAGDQDAMKWLVGIGVVGAGLAGAYALSKKQPAKEMGAPKSGVVSEKMGGSSEQNAGKYKPNWQYYDPSQPVPENLKVVNPALPNPVKPIAGPAPQAALPRTVPGPTMQQMQTDTAYAQKAAQDVKAARVPVPGAKARQRAYDVSDALRMIGGRRK